MPPPSRDSMVPVADEPRQQVFELGELDLPLALACPRPPGEDVENELGSIQHLPIERVLELTQLSRRQLVVEHHEVDVGLCARHGQRSRLSAADERGRIRLGALLQHAQHHSPASRLGQARQLVERRLRIDAARCASDEADECHTFNVRSRTHASAGVRAVTPYRTISTPYDDDATPESKETSGAGPGGGIGTSLRTAATPPTDGWGARRQDGSAVAPPQAQGKTGRP
jgi:hypothetical protein